MVDKHKRLLLIQALIVEAYDVGMTDGDDIVDYVCNRVKNSTMGEIIAATDELMEAETHGMRN